MIREQVSIALKRLDEDEVILINLTDSLDRLQKTNVVTESGLYSLVLSSRKLEAKAFKKWVTSEVLPAIRKTGKYEMKTNLPISVLRQSLDLLESQGLVIENHETRLTALEYESYFCNGSLGTQVR